MVGRRFDEATVEHIKEMTKHRLERDLVSGKLDVPLATLPMEKEQAAPAGNLLQLQTASLDRLRKTA